MNIKASNSRRRSVRTLAVSLSAALVAASVALGAPAGADPLPPAPDGIYIDTPWVLPGGQLQVQFVGSTPECGNGFDGYDTSFAFRDSDGVTPLGVAGFGEGALGFVWLVVLQDEMNGYEPLTLGTTGPLSGELVVTCTPNGGGAAQEYSIPLYISSSQPSTPYNSYTAWTWLAPDAVAEGATITASALGFAPGETATVSMLNESIAYAGGGFTLVGAVAGPASVQADGEGAVTAQFTVPAGWSENDDVVLIVAGDESGYLLLAGSGSPLEGTPALALSGNSRAFTGGAVQVEASGYDPGETVVVALHSASAAAVPLATLVANGSGEIQGFVAVPSGLATGLYRIWAGASEIGFLLLNAPLQVNEAPDSDRISGENRYETAVATSQRFAPFAEGLGTVYVTSGQAFPDALGAGALAAQVDAPVLLTDPTALPDSVRAELIRLQPAEIIVVGGTAAVSPSVFSALQGLSFAHTTTRVAGENRYETNRALIENALDEATTVYIAVGTNFPDALAAGPAAASVDGAVVLVNGSASSLDAETLALLDSLNVEEVRLVGGTAAISPAIETQLLGLYPGKVLRLAGENRYATAALIVGGAWSDTVPEVILASGANFPDALAAGALGIPLLTTDPVCLPPTISAQLGQLAPTEVNLVGGTAALSANVANYGGC